MLPTAGLSGRPVPGCQFKRSKVEVTGGQKPEENGGAYRGGGL